MDQDLDALFSKIDRLPSVEAKEQSAVEALVASSHASARQAAAIEQLAKSLEQKSAASREDIEQLLAGFKPVAGSGVSPELIQALEARDTKLLSALGAMLATIKPAQTIEPAKPGRPAAAKGVTYEAVPERNVQDRITRVLIRPVP